MKKISSLLTLVFFSVNLFSNIELSFGLNSKSIWRGLDQNDGNPTIYSEIDYEKNGFISMLGSKVVAQTEVQTQIKK